MGYGEGDRGIGFESRLVTLLQVTPIVSKIFKNSKGDSQHFVIKGFSHPVWFFLILILLYLRKYKIIEITNADRKVKDFYVFREKT